MKRCVMCKGGKLTTVQVEERREIAGRVFTTSLAPKRCASCGEEYYDGNELAAFDLAVAGELAVHGVVAPEVFSFMRKTLGMQARELASLLDVAPATVSRWEHGKLPLERGPVALLSAMVLDKIEGRSTTLERLRALDEPTPLPKRVRLELRHV